ncbi:MAG TPA: ACT domain-containing protein [Mycobacteriales bacterium]|nr:ACT domain-containing protein [Mycobacteriales bacterium]
MSQSSSYLLRVRLPDQPGVLGRVATALGSAGADIESIAVVDRADGYAVDDLVVALPPGALADRLVSAVTAIPGVIVETVQRHHGRSRMYDDLTLLDLATTSREPLLALVEGLPGLLQVSYALVVARNKAGVIDVLAASAGAPDSPMRDWLPVDGPQTPDAAAVWADPSAAGPDCELLAMPYRTNAVLLLGRMGGPAYLPTEVTRVAHLARVARALFAEIGR